MNAPYTHLGTGRRMPAPARILAGLALALSAVGLLAGAAPVRAADAQVALSGAELDGGVVHLGLGKSMVVDLPADVKDIMVSNPATADAVLRSSRQLFVIGVAVGEVNVILFGDGGVQLGELNVVVARDTAGLEQMIRTMVPKSKVSARAMGDMILLTGEVPTAEAGQQIASLAGKYIGSDEKIVNSLTVGGSDQVNLRVVIAEVQRNVARQLGVDFAYSQSIGDVIFKPIQNYAPVDGGSLKISANGFSATLKALQDDGVLRTLAEPNLTAVSGEDATFLVGGELPYLAGIQDGVSTYSYKPYGVSLNFTPVVLSPGRIVLRIMTEISEKDSTNSAGGLPAFITRRAQTTVELPSGGSIAIGGLLQDKTQRQNTGTPGLMDLPILGALFKSAAYQRNQTELVIFVTPYEVDPVATSAMTRPDQNLTFTRDAQNLFLGQVNQIYARGRSPAGNWTGNVGFAFE